MLPFLSPNLMSGMASSLLMGGIKGLLAPGAAGMQQQPVQSPIAASMGLPMGKAPVMRPPMMLGGASYMASGGIASLPITPPLPPGEDPKMAYAMDKGGMIRGPGGGVDDLISGSIDNRQKVLLSDGEFVVPARVVSALGDGSSEAGAKVLHGMLDRVKKEAEKRLKDNGEINLKKVLPA